MTCPRTTFPHDYPLTLTLPITAGGGGHNAHPNISVSSEWLTAGFLYNNTHKNIIILLTELNARISTTIYILASTQQPNMTESTQRPNADLSPTTYWCRRPRTYPTRWSYVPFRTPFGISPPPASDGNMKTNINRKLFQSYEGQPCDADGDIAGLTPMLVRGPPHTSPETTASAPPLSRPATLGLINYLVHHCRHAPKP